MECLGPAAHELNCRRNHRAAHQEILSEGSRRPRHGYRIFSNAPENQTQAFWLKLGSNPFTLNLFDFSGIRDIWKGCMNRLNAECGMRGVRNEALSFHLPLVGVPVQAGPTESGPVKPNPTNSPSGSRRITEEQRDKCPDCWTKREVRGEAMYTVRQSLRPNSTKFD